MQCLLVDPYPKETEGDYKVTGCVPQVWQYLWCHEAFSVTEQRDPVALRLLSPKMIVY